MRRSSSWQVLVLVVFVLLVLMGCRSADGEVTDVPNAAVEVEPVMVGDVQVTLLAANLRESVQTSYIVSVPPPKHTYLELALEFEGVQDPLEWAQTNLGLDYLGQQPEFAFTPRPKRAVSDNSLHYLFTYLVPEDADFAAFQVQFADGQRISLEPFELMAQEPTVDAAQGLGTVNSGQYNAADGRNAVVSGGANNTAMASHATVGGGSQNVSSAQNAVVGGGSRNEASGARATVGGGQSNTASQLDTTVAGGASNVASGTHATVGGGSHNTASGRDATISGGYYNVAEATNATVSGGTENQANGFGATVGGGAGNHADDNHATVAGGLGNQAAGTNSTVGGGQGNAADGALAVVPGGLSNQAAGDYSLAAGRRATVQARHAGVFLFADSSDVDFASVAADEFAVRASGGVRLVTAVDELGNPLAGVELPAGSGSWSTLSDRNAKENLMLVDGQQVLQQLVELPISTWNYKTQDLSIQHMGPMAQDFHGAFGVGEDAEHISAVDADGVALAAIQGLYQQVQVQEEQLAAQQARIADLETRLTALEDDGRGGTSSGLVGGLWPLVGLVAIGVILRPRRS